MSNKILHVIIKASIILYLSLIINPELFAQDSKSEIAKINFVCQDCSYEQTEKGYYFDVSDGSGEYKIIITHKEYTSTIKIYKKNKEILNTKIDGYIMDIGIVDLNNNLKNVFIVTGQGASGILTTMTMIELNNHSTIYLSFGNPYWHLPQIDRSDNFYFNKYKDASDFLEKIKYEFGYFDNEYLIDNEKNPTFMYENWLRINDNIDFGKISFTKYSGSYTTEGTVNSEIFLKNKKYTAYFKGGVVVNDYDNNEYYVLFAPHDYYSWPNIILNYNKYLFIGTRGEGLAVINLENNVLKRIELGKEFNDVENISMKNGKIIINKYKQVNFTEF